MFQKIFCIFVLIISLQSCSKEKLDYEPKNRADPYKLYQEGFEAFERGNYFLQIKSFLKPN